MAEWRKRIAAVFGIDLPVGEGSGKSLEDPLKIPRTDSTHPDDIIQQWLHYRSVLEEKHQSVIRKVRLQLDDQLLIRYDMLCSSHSFTEDTSVPEHIYFDISEWNFGAENAVESGDVTESELLPKLFSGLEDYIDFYLDEESLSRSANNDRFILELKRCKARSGWILILEDRLKARASAIFMKVMDPSPQNLHHFEDLCLHLLRKLPVQ